MIHSKSSSEAYNNSALKVLNRVRESLDSLESWLGEPFYEAVELVLATKGRVILSGMGKSGHIARKIAATMASTGTPATFVHPAEASHGDLGMITEKDTVILLSNSGETKELQDITFYCKRFSIPLISIVRRSKSSLVGASNVALILPEVPEATSVNAPTTSTTMMIVLGDALAVAILEKKGFTAEDFGTYHPGGKLGAAFLRVSDLMHKGKTVPSVKLDTKMTDALLEITKKSLGCAAVVDSDNNVIGVITDGDLRRNMTNDIITKLAKDVMTASPLVIQKSMLATEALALMEKKSITSLLVVHETKLEGVLHIHDILRAGVA